MKRILILLITGFSLKAMEWNKNPRAVVPFLGAAGVSAITAFGSSQCYRIAQSIPEKYYGRILKISGEAVDLLIKNPDLMKALAWKYESRTLTTHELENAARLLGEFRGLLREAHPVLYMATGALAATSLFYAYQAVAHMYDITQEPGIGITPSGLQIEPFITMGDEGKLALKTLSYGSAAALGGLAMNKVGTIATLFEFDSWETTLNFVESILADMRDHPRMTNVISWWTHDDKLNATALENAISGVNTAKSLVSQTPAALNILKGALAAATLYGTYKMVTCGYEYFKYKQAQSAARITKADGD